MRIQPPKNQKICETILMDGVPKYIVTRNQYGTQYILYSVNENGTITKLSTNKTPIFKELKNDS